MQHASMPIAGSAVVLTSVVSTRDFLRDDQCVGGARYVAYVDRAWASKTWEQLPAYTLFHSPRRNSRIPKILPHQFVDAEYSLWLDACIGLRKPLPDLVQEWLQDADIAVFAHEKRTCTYAEAEECRKRKLDDPRRIAEQAAAYRSRGFPPEAGLARCSVILRRHNAQVETFNNLWWSEYCRHSVRDQISFVYAAFKAKVRVNYIFTPIHQHPYFHINRRMAEPEQPSVA